MSESNWKKKVFYFPSSDGDTYRVFIDDEITEPSDYRDVITALRGATERDMVEFEINSMGGCLHTALAITSAIEDCAALTVANVSRAESAAMFLVMACEGLNIEAGAVCMVHNFQTSYGYNIPSNLQGNLEAEKYLFKTLVERYLKELLTEEEMKDILETSRDIYFKEYEIEMRLNKDSLH